MNPHASAVELAAAIKSKEVSSLELTQMYIDRVEKYDDKINAVGGEYQDYITIDFARLMADELGGFVPPPNYP